MTKIRTKILWLLVFALFLFAFAVGFPRAHSKPAVAFVNPVFSVEIVKTNEEPTNSAKWEIVGPRFTNFSIPAGTKTFEFKGTNQPFYEEEKIYGTNGKVILDIIFVYEGQNGTYFQTGEFRWSTNGTIWETNR